MYVYVFVFRMIHLLKALFSLFIIDHFCLACSNAGWGASQGGASEGGASGSMVVTATHVFAGEQPGDLSFVPGDRITVITKTDSQFDWWEGQLEDGRVGIFPANFVTY